VKKDFCARPAEKEAIMTRHTLCSWKYFSPIELGISIAIAGLSAVALLG
jgi:hypothetical protein